MPVPTATSYLPWPRRSPTCACYGLRNDGIEQKVRERIKSQLIPDTNTESH